LRLIDSPLEVLRDSLKFLDQGPELARHDLRGVFDAMVQVRLDEFLLGIAHGFFDGMQLLRKLHARAPRIEHLHYSREVAMSAFQPRDDLWKFVCHSPADASILSWGRG